LKRRRRPNETIAKRLNMPDSGPSEFLRLCGQCAVKVVNFETIDAPAASSVDDNIVCYIEAEHSYCDSMPKVCKEREEAREEASRQFNGLIEMYGGESNIGNLAGRSSSPAAMTTPRGLERARSYSGAPLQPIEQPRRRSLGDSLKSFLGRKKKKK